jgi:MFS family permease
MNAIALNSAMFNTGRILGPAVAGVILAAFGPAVCFAINAVSYIAVIIGLLMMKVKPLVKTVAGSAAEQLREGLSFVRRTPDVLRPVLLVAAVGTFGMSFNVWLPLLARDSFNADAGTFGLLFSSMGAGSLVGALAIAFFGRTPDRLRMLLAAALLGILEVGVAVAASVPLAVGMGMLLLAGCGFAASNAMAMANTIVQTTAPDALRGRVMAVYSTVFMGSTPIGALVAGAISQQAGVVPSMITGGSVVAIVALTLTWLQRASRITAAPTVITDPAVTKHA